MRLTADDDEVIFELFRSHHETPSPSAPMMLISSEELKYQFSGSGKKSGAGRREEEALFLEPKARF